MNATPAKLVALLSVLAGLVMIMAGALTWATVTSQLTDENITVPADASSFAGKKVAGPFTAYSQAETIKKHALHATEGRTYAQLGKEIKEAEAAKDTAKAEELTQLRTQAMNGSFLRASLFTSVVSYGISALVMGLGLLSMLVGWALRHLAKLAEARTGDADRVRGGATAARA